MPTERTHDEEALERTVTLRDGTPVRLRPIRPDDDTGLVALFGRLSERTIYHRFFTVRRSLPPAWVHLLTHVDYQRRMAIVAERGTADGLIGVARYDVTEAEDTAEIALVVEDAWQGLGLGTILLHEIMRAGEARGIRVFRLDVLSENRRMLHLIARETEIVSRTTSQGVTEALVQARH
jgi:GNAT superfamily N-acetyltransferase